MWIDQVIFFLRKKSVEHLAISSNSIFRFIRQNTVNLILFGQFLPGIKQLWFWKIITQVQS